jgi:hypothetical protein
MHGRSQRDWRTNRAYGQPHLMSTVEASMKPAALGPLLRGEVTTIVTWLQRWNTRTGSFHIAVILLGAGLYGAAMGAWRAPMQAVVTAIKFPLVILLTTLGNALLNGMLAPLLGLNISFRQSLLVVLMSFTIAAAILGSFSSIAYFIVWNTASVGARSGSASLGYSFMQLTHVALIAFAGVLANMRLVPVLRELSGSAVVARKVLFAWLAGNLLLGSQICWVLRPFIGRPDLDVEILGQHPLQSNFFEQVFEAARQFVSP